MFKDCGTCTICCEGWLTSIAYGNLFGNKKPCIFLCEKTCLIYTTRPKTCSYYQCAWSQGLFPDWMKPTESNVLISVEYDNQKKQFLKVIELGISISDKVFNFIENWVKENNTYYILVKDKNVTKF